jgi:hypothetical protein
MAGSREIRRERRRKGMIDGAEMLERDERAGVAGLGHVAGPRRRRREHAGASERAGHAVGPSRRKEGKAARNESFSFSFSKM